jgi:hypothetical protein
MKLTTSYEEFKNSTDELLKEGQSLIQSPITESDLKEAIASLKAWKDKCVRFLQESFGEKFNSLIQDFQRAGHNGFAFDGMRKDLEFRISTYTGEFKDSIGELTYITRLLSLVDPIISPTSYDPTSRQSMTVDQKTHFLMEKLREAAKFNQGFPVGWLYKANGIQFNRPDEWRSIAKKLDLNKYIDLWGGDGDLIAAITIEGIQELENFERKIIASSQATVVHNSIQIEKMTNSVIQQGSNHSVQQVTLSADYIVELKDFLNELKSSIDSLQLSNEQKGELEAEIATIEAQIKSPKPKNVIIKDTLTFIKSILEKATITAISTKLIPIAKELWEKIHSAN